VALTAEQSAGYDAVLIATDHDQVDYARSPKAPLIVDTRNVFARRGIERGGSPRVSSKHDADRPFPLSPQMICPSSSGWRRHGITAGLRRR
jgi:hypothetical protein